jgi:hypothetical protein
MRGLLAEGFSLFDQNHANTGFQRNVQFFLIAGPFLFFSTRNAQANYFVFISRYTGQ